MPRIAPFEAHHERYDSWFERHQAAYYSELLAIRALLPWEGRGLEVGVGTGRFAAPLGVQCGVDPSPAMQGYAARRGISVRSGTAEELPFEDESFDTVLMVTTFCFVDDLCQAFAEAHRVLCLGGQLVIGFIDRASKLGEEYLHARLEQVFYREATFHSGPEVDALLSETGFENSLWVQTLSKQLDDMVEIEPIRSGHGQALFVVVRAERCRASRGT
jgi:SAM-dependent methyltransferase